MEVARRHKAHTHTHTHTVGILLPPPRAPEPVCLDMGDIRERERHENRDPALELDHCRAVKSDKMAMSEQLESEGGESLLLTFSFLSFSPEHCLI